MQKTIWVWLTTCWIGVITSRLIFIIIKKYIVKIELSFWYIFIIFLCGFLCGKFIEKIYDLLLSGGRAS